VVAFTAHLGGWELLAGILDSMRPDYRRIVIVRSQRNPAVNALISHLRGVSGGVEVAEHRNASAAILRVLRENGTTAFLVDHNTGSDEALFLPFLGETAAVNQGPALLALRGKAVLYAVFLVRRPDATYEIHTVGPFDTSELKGSIAERSRQITGFYTRTAEDFIRKYPEQWFWMHRRWKTRPPDENNGGMA
jgi:KDO2-lipid IV(A) lauroyltransferase